MKLFTCYYALGFIITLGFSAPALGAEGDSLWSRIFGGEGDDGACSVIETSDGSYLLAGSTSSFGLGSTDAWLIKTDLNGNQLWSRTYGGDDYDVACSVIETQNGDYVLAGTTTSFSMDDDSDMWLLKANSDGDSLWSYTYGDSYEDYANSVVEADDGGYLLVGANLSSYAGSSSDIYLVKTDSEGNQLWSQLYGGDGADKAQSVISIGEGYFVLTGYAYDWATGLSDMVLMKIDSTGYSPWSYTYGGDLIDVAYDVESDEYGYLLVGVTASFGGGGQDVFLLKTDLEGDSLWSRTYGGSTNEVACAAVQTSDGGYILAANTLVMGGSGFATDTWPLKVNSNGDSLWSRTYDMNQMDMANSVIQTSDGGYLLVGRTSTSEPGIYDAFMMYLEGPDTTAVGPNNPHQPIQYVLYPVFPNPFNPTATISFALPVACWVKLEVFDVTGQRVGAQHAAPLLSGWHPAGKHEVIFDGSGLASGVYLYRLQAGDFQGSGKMVLMK